MANLGKFTEDEVKLIYSQIDNCTALPSGRYMWCGGTQWSDKPENYSGSYNCTSTVIDSIETFGHLMNLSMQGAGCGAVLELDNIDKLPPIKTKLNINVIGNPGDTPIDERSDDTFSLLTGANTIDVIVGDSRRGWVESYMGLIQLACSDVPEGEINLNIDLSDVRPKGEPLSGFGGVANPLLLRDLYGKVANILNGAVGRQLTSIECCLLICEAAMVVVVGNIRRCVAEGTLINTSNGLVPIEDLVVGDLVLTPTGLKPVTATFDQGLQDVYSVNTNGVSPRLTANHRVATGNALTGEFEWKQVSELVEGDRLLHIQSITPGTQTILPPDNTENRPSNSRNAGNLIIPQLDTDVAWLIGLIHGNGYVSLGRNKHGKPYGALSISANAQKSDIELSTAILILKKASKVLDLFGVSSKISLINGENTIKLVASNIRLAEYLADNVKTPNTEIQIPNWILTANPNIRAAYLSGLFDSDGSIKTRPINLVTTVYERFSHQIVAMYSSIGIPTRVRKHIPKEVTWKTKYMVNLPCLKPEFNALVACFSIKGVLPITGLQNGFTLLKSDLADSFTKKELVAKGFNPLSKTQNWKAVNERLATTKMIPITFEGLHFYNSMPTYDIEVADGNCFYSEGILIHNSALIFQFSQEDELARNIKYGLWKQHEDGSWYMPDPKLDSLRMGNHTTVFHSKPTLEQCIKSVSDQYYSGEGAIQWAGEAVARANADLLDTPDKKAVFLGLYGGDRELARDWLDKLGQIKGDEEFDSVLQHRMARYGLNPCGEIQMCNNYCNLAEVHLNRLNPFDLNSQVDAFKAATLNVAALLHHELETPRYQNSRELDPIVGVSFTGLFDFFVHLFGVEWLQWWQSGRPKHWGDPVNIDRDSRYKPLLDCDFTRVHHFDSTSVLFLSIEEEYLCSWRCIVADTVAEYCERHGLKVPNRYTTVQPAGSKSLLTGASPGWHPPKAARYIRRMTFGRDEPIALAAIDLGYNVIPSQSDKDEHGNLLDDTNDPRVTEWLVEIPCAASWADLPGVDAIDISQFSALAQFDFYMQVQRYYSTHTTSATIELREHEIEALATAIYEDIQNDGGYMSAALLARFDDHQTMPRMPFEPIDKDRYQQELANIAMRRTVSDFDEALALHDRGQTAESGPSGCDSDKCLLPDKK